MKPHQPATLAFIVAVAAGAIAMAAWLTMRRPPAAIPSAASSATTSSESSSTSPAQASSSSPFSSSPFSSMAPAAPAAASGRDEATASPVDPLPRPAARPDDYVGSRACADCHAEIFQRYQGHPMANSMATIGQEPPIETLTEEILLEPAGPQHAGHEYVVQWDGEQMRHGERMRDAEGSLIYEQLLPVRFAMGSGRRGRAYMIDRDGRLTQSPIGWYSQGQRWDLSPGYHEDPSLRFERAIGDGCLYCHAGRVEHAADDPSRYGEQVFLEASIGCERCHGPGGRHVTAMEQLAAGEACDDCQIVNPADLDPARREAVCNQCHLAGEAAIPRYGRGLFDFRPGDHLDETLVVFVEGRRGEGSRAVSQVEQMQASRCYQASGQAMGCTTCHDPHWQPPPQEAVAFFDSRCATCHESDDCSLEAAARLAHESNGSCIACHMPSEEASDVPHTAMTDHSIPRDAARAAAGRSVPRGRQGNPVVFDDGEQRLPSRALARARGMLLATIAVDARSPQMAAQAAELLTPAEINPSKPAEVVAPLAGDVEALLSLAELFDGVGQAGLTAACYASVLETDPVNQTALMGMARIEQGRGSLTTALAFADRLVAVNDTVAEVHMLRGVILGGLGRWQEAIAAARQAIDLDPTRIDARRWLVRACRVAGDAEQAASEERIIARMESVATP